MGFFSRKQSNSGFSLIRLVFSIGLPVFLLLAFLARQFLNFNDIGLSNGFSHPLTGWDHLVTMLAVGVWAAQLRGKAIWMLPLTFVGVMSLGGLAGVSGLNIPNVDGIILVSCAVFSVLITRNMRFSSKINVLIVAFFAFFHGFAHGQEISASASLISYILGFMLATLLLHGAGILLAKLLVLAVTCLLTVLFSTSALAKTAESVIDTNDNQFIVKLCQTTVNPGYVSLIPQERSYQSVSPGFGREQVTSKDFARQGTEGGGLLRVTDKTTSELSAMVNGKYIGHQSKQNTGSDYLVLIVKHDHIKSCENPVYQRLYPSYSSDCSNLDFKNFFPKINHTPGRHFLSNGVGLTSPPVLFAYNRYLTPHSSSVLRNTSRSSRAGQFLRLNPAKIYFGNLYSYTETSKNFRQFYALRNTFVAKVVVNPGRNNFAFSILNTSFICALCLAALAISEFHLLNASSLFAGNRINQQTCKALHPPNEMIKINGIA